MNQKNMLKPIALKAGDTLGIFTPSSPAYLFNPGLFENGIKNLESLGFKVKLGSVTRDRKSQGYRSATPKERAEEVMELVHDPAVRGLIATIGGMNSSSLIPFLDFQKIRETRKVFCGFSDVTSLHLAIAKYSGLRTFYGPTVMCWFGEWPNGNPESTESFLQAVMRHTAGARHFDVPKKWSNHKRDWGNGDWKNLPREWKENNGWKVLSPGSVEAEIVPANLNTLMTACGTEYFPELKGKILLIEDMDAPQSRSERSLQQLSLMGVFDQIAGLIIGKPEFYDQQGAPFNYDELIQEMVGSRAYPIVSNFDSSHTVPMLTIPRYAQSSLVAKGGAVALTLLEGSVEVI
jgi:muramoyltetrapeptide carboxypeptidase